MAVHLENNQEMLVSMIFLLFQAFQIGNEFKQHLLLQVRLLTMHCCDLFLTCCFPCEQMIRNTAVVYLSNEMVAIHKEWKLIEVSNIVLHTLLLYWSHNVVQPFTTLLITPPFHCVVLLSVMFYLHFRNTIHMMQLHSNHSTGQSSTKYFTQNGLGKITILFWFVANADNQFHFGGFVKRRHLHMNLLVTMCSVFWRL